MENRPQHAGPMAAPKLRMRTRAWEITALYVACGLLWIFFSDRALAFLATDPDRLVAWSSYKGYGFVAVTACLLLLLLTHAFRVIGDAYASLTVAERDLRNARTFSDTMVESMPGILYLYDNRGQFLRWNKNFEAVSGYSSAEIERLTPGDFFAGSDRAIVEQRIEEVFASGESSVEASFVARDGASTPYYFTGRRVAFDGKNCLVGMGIDISARRQAEQRLVESEQQYRDLVQQANSIILRWDAQGRVLFMNDFGLQFFGYRADELVGRHVVGTIVPPVESDGRDLQHMVDAIRERPESFEQNVNENIRRDGQRVWIAWNNRIKRDSAGRAVEILSIGTDITDRMRIEEEREKRVRAEEADRFKSAFLATMSHELRTPLNSIIGFTGIILQGLAGELTDEQHKQLTMVQISARHLLALVNDVLDLSKIEAGQLELSSEAFDIEASIQKVAHVIAPQADAKGLDLNLQIDSPLGEMVGDQRRFEQILLNLLSNGIKFTERGSVTLAASRGENASPHESASLLRIRIIDTGIGIRQADLALLFQPFSQIETGIARRHEGTGLGLAICRRLTDLMGGEIEAQSEWGAGSTFTVVLPVMAPVAT